MIRCVVLETYIQLKNISKTYYNNNKNTAQHQTDQTDGRTMVLDIDDEIKIPLNQFVVIVG